MKFELVSGEPVTESRLLFKVNVDHEGDLCIKVFREGEWDHLLYIANSDGKIHRIRHTDIIPGLTLDSHGKIEVAP